MGPLTKETKEMLFVDKTSGQNAQRKLSSG